VFRSTLTFVSRRTIINLYKYWANVEYDLSPRVTEPRVYICSECVLYLKSIFENICSSRSRLKRN